MPTLQTATRAFKRLIYSLIVLVVLGLAAFVLVTQYSFIFSHDVDGQVIGIERVTDPNTVFNMGTAIPNEQLYSFAVAIKAHTGEIYSSSSEDRQWAVVQKDMCVSARFYPYPPWNLAKSGTYHNARLTRIQDCPGTPK